MLNSARPASVLALVATQAAPALRARSPHDARNVGLRPAARTTLGFHARATADVTVILGNALRL